MERSIVSVRYLNSIKIPYKRFTGQFGLASCKSYLVWTRKPQISCGERSHFGSRGTESEAFGVATCFSPSIIKANQEPGGLKGEYNR